MNWARNWLGVRGYAYCSLVSWSLIFRLCLIVMYELSNDIKLLITFDSVLAAQTSVLR